MHGPKTLYSQHLHGTKYRGQGEDFREAMGRIASALRSNDQHYAALREMLLDLRFLPAGRIQASVGSTRKTTPYNCYVSGTIRDAFVNGENSIMARAVEAATTMRLGGGDGYDFSTLRPRGDLIKQLQSHSSGPVSFMSIFDAICKCVASSGHRRGAQMGVLRVDHPDIEEFIKAKQVPPEVQPLWDLVQDMEEGDEKRAASQALQSTLKLSGFNLSVAVTDKFMECLDTGEPFPLKFNGVVYRTVNAEALWESLMRSTWDWAEPGVLFIDTINRMNNLYYCERIAATNPCGEQPLPPNGACLLGSFNLVRYLRKSGDGWTFDHEAFKRDIPIAVEALDNVIDGAVYPLPDQQTEAENKRRMGLGVTGLANTGEALGFPYGSPAFLVFEDWVTGILKNEAYRASAMLASKRGTFPLYHAASYLTAPFIRTLDEDVQDLIRRYGVHNSHLTSIAPTGTISMCADNVSSSIEPVFSYETTRTVIMPDGPEEVHLSDYGVKFLGVRGKTCEQVTVGEHLGVLLTATQNVDSAVSKTCNVGSDVSWQDFKQVYVDAWRGGAKGCTTFRLGGKRFGLLKPKTTPTDGETCEIDPVTGKKNCG